MEAMVSTHYGGPDVLQLKDVAKPTPKAKEVLITIHAASSNSADGHYLRGAPLVFGADVAGRVEAVGRDVTLFQPGDAVFGDLSTCGRGTCADYVCASEDALALKPANTTVEAAAVVPLAAVRASCACANLAFPF